MKINLTARHFDLSISAREYCQEAVRGLEKYFDRINDVQVVLDKEKERWKAEMIVGVPGRTLTSNSETDQLFTAVDEAAEKMSRQIERYKARINHEKDRREAQQSSAAASAAERQG